MQVPTVAAQVMEWVSVGDPDAQTLMGQIKTIDVFKVYPGEARVQSTRCHAPNRFGTVNMEDNVNIKRS